MKALHRQSMEAVVEQSAAMLLTAPAVAKWVNAGHLFLFFFIFYFLREGASPKPDMICIIS